MLKFLRKKPEIDQEITADDLWDTTKRAGIWLSGAAIWMVIAINSYDHRHAIVPAATEARDAAAEAVADLLAIQAKASDNSGEYSGGAPHQTWDDINPNRNGWHGPGDWTIMNFIAAKEKYERDQLFASVKPKPVVVAKPQHRKPVSVARVAPQPKPELPLALINFMRLSSNN